MIVVSQRVDLGERMRTRVMGFFGVWQALVAYVEIFTVLTMPVMLESKQPVGVSGSNDATR